MGQGLPLVFFLVAAGAPSVVCRAEEPVRLSDARLATKPVLVKLAVEARGELQGDGDSASAVPMSVSGASVYHERYFPPKSTQPGSCSAIRAYERAHAKLSVGGESEEISLAASEATIAVFGTDRAPTFYAVSGRISRQELDVLRIPCHSLVAYQLLATTPVRVGDSWVIAAPEICAVLQLDEVTESDVRGKLVEVSAGLAKIQLHGDLIGRADGAITEISLSGEMRYDLRAQGLRWLQVRIKEERGPGPTAPPFKVVAETRMLIEPAADLPAVLQNCEAPNPRPSDLLLKFSSPRGGFHLLHPREWTIVSDHEKQTVLRLTKGRDVVAQCNLTRLPDSEKGKHLGLEAFQEDIRKALKEQFLEFEEARQETRKDGLRVLRVVVQGTVKDGPVHWIYYHLESPRGERASFVCTFAAESAKLQAFDRLAAATLKFAPVKRPAKASVPLETAKRPVPPASPPPTATR
ncbi:MAG TPA: hypothetical protein VIY86_03660 [Pirellulaceae bacterium]